MECETRIEKYKSRLNPFTVGGAREFVGAHRNIFSNGVRKRVVIDDENFILICETEYDPEGQIHRNYWGFSKGAYVALVCVGKMSDKEAEKIARQELKLRW